ncbi:MAG: DUF1801 domain-containing protein [Pseudomonadota bacterium]
MKNLRNKNTQRQKIQHRPFQEGAVKAAFEGIEDDIRAPLLNLRELIFTVADQMDEIGRLVETLKWGQPAYLPEKPNVGTTIRLGKATGREDACALFFHCQTRLIEDFRAIHADHMDFQGNRAIVFSATRPPDEQAVKDCIRAALTYHLKKRTR